jgi:hypothetical protein
LFIIFVFKDKDNFCHSHMNCRSLVLLDCHLILKIVGSPEDEINLLSKRRVVRFILGEDGKSF